MNQDELESFREAWLVEVALAKSQSQTPSPSKTPPTHLSQQQLTTRLSELILNQESEESKLESLMNSQPKTASKQEDAVEAYLKATQFERQGNLNSALKQYRMAEKLDPNIHQIIRQNPKLMNVNVEGSSSKGEPDFNTFYSFGGNDIPKTNAFDQPESISRLLLNQFQQIHFISENENKNCVLETIPNEILVQILQWNILWDPGFLLKLACVCKKMYILVREQSLWRFLCERVHHSIELNSNLMFELKLDFESDWMKMWMLKPRVRFDGAYISRVNYVRQGYDEDYNGFNAPVHLVTYYR